MSWSIFSYTAIPAGVLLAALLLSGNSLAMRAASKVLATPIEVGNLQLNLAVIMTAFCGCLSVLSYAGLHRSSYLADQVKASASMADRGCLQDLQMRNVFHQGRNFYLSLLGLMIWATAWRLKVLHDQNQLSPPQASARRMPKSMASRAAWVLVGLLALLIADVPLCRLNYNLQLLTFVTPQKERLLHQKEQCSNVFMSNAGGPCIEFCDNVRKLSIARSEAVMFVRDWHPLGRLAAELFDGARSMRQGEERIDELFQKKTCVQVLLSTDKSNQLVNVICVVCAVLAITGAFAALSQGIFDSTALDGPQRAAAGDGPSANGAGAPAPRGGADDHHHRD
eukprot:gb/GFBE01041055.1/.p1 GENE.gb/GFBE01041055.1/~~gb/GFBE01041055.1/.p1  ORF type:complete len:338 (+),score=58.43 gb/GFBE01041055.1/:1-1014(+)